MLGEIGNDAISRTFGTAFPTADRCRGDAQSFGQVSLRHAEQSSPLSQSTSLPTRFHMPTFVIVAHINPISTQFNHSIPYDAMQHPSSSKQLPTVATRLIWFIRVAYG